VSSITIYKEDTPFWYGLFIFQIYPSHKLNLQPLTHITSIDCYFNFVVTDWQKQNHNKDNFILILPIAICSSSQDHGRVGGEVVPSPNREVSLIFFSSPFFCGDSDVIVSIEFLSL
jgi:hypothetical protein